MAVTLDSVQVQFLQSLDQIRALSAEVGNMNSEVDYLNNDHIAKVNIIEACDQQIASLSTASLARAVPARSAAVTVRSS